MPSPATKAPMVNFHGQASLCSSGQSLPVRWGGGAIAGCRGGNDKPPEPWSKSAKKGQKREKLHALVGLWVGEK